MVDLAKVRKRCGMSQEDLANKVGIARTTISNIECGLASPSIVNAQAIAKVLGFDWQDFYNFTTEKETINMTEMLFTIKEVSEILKCNVNFVYKLQKAGLIPFLKLGTLKCRKESLEEFLKKYEGYDLTDPDNVKELKG